MFNLKHKFEVLKKKKKIFNSNLQSAGLDQTNQTEGLQSTYILKSKLKIPKIFHVVREHFMSYKTRNTPFNIVHDLIIMWTAASVCCS